MPILYHHPYSQHSRRVIALLNAAELDHELRYVALEKQENMSPEYLRVNANHQVPTLIDGDVVVHESNAILRYLCVKHSLNSWYPTVPAVRAKVEQWLDWNQCQLSPAVVDIVLNKVFMGEHADKDAIVRGQKALPELSAVLNAGLTSSAFLAGEQPTIADLSVASNISHLGLADEMPQQGNIRSWFAEMCDIESFSDTLPPAVAA